MFTWNHKISVLPFLLLFFSSGSLLFLWNAQPLHLSMTWNPFHKHKSNEAMDGSPPNAPAAPPAPLPLSSQHLTIPSKITLIALWSTNDRPANYLPNFFASVAANPSIDLLFIKFDKYNRVGCEQPMTAEHSNVREVCLTIHEYWDLHAEFLCRHWGCSDDDRNKVFEALIERSPGDVVCHQISISSLFVLIALCQGELVFPAISGCHFRKVGQSWHKDMGEFTYIVSDMQILTHSYNRAGVTWIPSSESKYSSN